MRAGVFFDPSTYDAVQGGYPVICNDTDYNPVALTLGSIAAAGPWFTGDEVWLNGVDNAAYVSGSGWTLTSASAWTIESKWSLADTGSQRRVFRDSLGAFCAVDGGGNIRYNDNDGHSIASASTVPTLLGIAATDPFWFRAIATPTTIVVDVSADGDSWVNAIPSSTISARALSTIHVGSNVKTSAASGRCSFMRVRDGGVSDPVVAHFTPALFPPGNREDAATATDAYSVTWTVERPDFSGDTTTPRRLQAQAEQHFSFPGETGETVSVARGSGVTTTEWVATYIDGSTDTGTTAADPVVIGDTDLDGDVVSIELRDGVSGPVYDTLDAADADPDSATWVSPTSAETVTINRAGGSGYSVIVMPVNVEGIQTDGVDDKAAVIGDVSTCNYAPATGLSVLVDARMYSAPGAYGRLVAATNTSDEGVAIQTGNNIERVYGRLEDAAAANAGVGNNADNITYGERFLFAGSFGDGDHEAYVDGSTVEVDGTAVAAIAAPEPLVIGMRPDGSSPLAATVFGLAVVGQRISDAAAVTIAAEGLRKK